MAGFPSASTIGRPPVSVDGTEGPAGRSLADRAHRAGRPAQAWLAFGAYLLASFLIFGLPVLGRFGSAFVGQGSADAQLYVWDLAWWPHAIANGLNPFLPTVVWAPQGVNMAWVTGLPGPSLVMAPLTLLVGPVVTSNTIALLAPALAGWAAYLLCREVTDRWWPAFAGGWLFAFSTYLNAQMRGHMNLFLVFPVVLAVYLVVRFARGRLSGRAFVPLLAAALVAEFSISTEVFASMTMFAVIAVAGACAFAPEARPPLRRAVPRIGLAYLLAAVPLAPYLWYAVTGAPTTPLRPIGGSAVDLLSYVIPRAGTLVGGDTFATFTSAFRANVSEDGAYLGPIVLAVVVAAVIVGRRERLTWLLAGFAALAGVLALGGYLHVDGHRSVVMPWLPLAHLPFLGNALPERFTMYVWLAVAVLVARWLARPARTRRLDVARWAAVALAALTLLPNVRMPELHTPVEIPGFFASGRYRAELRPGETVLILYPPKDEGEEMLWQASTGFAFRMAQGHTGPQPSAFAADPLWQGVAGGQLFGATADQLRIWLHDHGVGAVIVVPGVLDKWRYLLDPMSGGPPVRMGDVYVYRPADGAATF